MYKHLRSTYFGTKTTTLIPENSYRNDQDMNKHLSQNLNNLTVLKPQFTLKHNLE